MRGKFWIRLLLCLVGIPVVLLAVAYLLAMQYVRTQEFSDRVSALLSSVTGRECRINGMISIGLLPEPHIEVRRVSVAQAAEFSGQPAFLEVESLGVYLAYSLLLDGSLAVDEFIADRPCMLLLHDDQGRNGWRDLVARALPGGSPWAGETSQGDFFPGVSPLLTFTLNDADVLLRNVDSGAVVHLANLDMRLQAGGEEPTRVTVESPSLMWGMEGAEDSAAMLAGLPNAFTGIRIEILSLPSPGPDQVALRLASGCGLKSDAIGVDCGIRLDSTMILDRSATTASVSGALEVNGTLTLNASTVPFDLHTPFFMHPDMTVDIADARLRFEGDSAQVSGTVRGMRERAPVMEGTATIEHLSLPRWFPFGRQLPSGLQHALGNIQGTMDFTVDTRGLIAPRMDAIIAGMPLTGSGRVEDFLNPAIVIDASAKAVDINKILPEMVESGIVDPVYAGPTVVSEEDDENLPDVGYDIKIKTAAVHVWRFDLGDFSFRCSPSPKGTVLDFVSNNAYGGKLVAAVDIIDEGYHTTFSASDMLVDEPARILAGYAAAAGRLTAKGDVIGDGRLLPEIMATLAGTMEGSLKNGSIRFSERPDEPAQTFSLFTVAGKAKGAGLPPSGEIPQRLPWAGDWKVGMQTNAGTSWDFAGTGTLQFDTDIGLPVAGAGIRGVLSARLAPPVTGLETPLPLRAEGLFSLDADADTFALAKGAIDIPGLTADADCAGSGLSSTIKAEGRMAAPRFSPRLLLPQLDIPLWEPEDPAVLEPASISARLVVNGPEASFEQMRLDWAGSAITGRVKRTLKERPLWEMDLQVDSMDLDRWLQKPAKPGEAAPPWPLDWLRRIDALGRIRADRVEFHKVLLENVSFPLRLTDGEFVSSGASSTIAGGTSTSTLRFTVNGGLLLNIVSDLKNVDIGQASLKLAGGAYIGGMASGHFDLAGTVRSGADIPSAISGSWSMQLLDGFYCTALNPEDPATPGAGMTSFTNAAASGILQSGVVHNDDLHVDGKGTVMKGSGWVDLVRKTLDYYVEVTIVGVPTVPVRLTGNLDSPTSQIQAGRMVTRTLGNIGSGAFGIIGGIFSLPLRALEAIRDPNLPPPDVRDSSPLDPNSENR